MSDRDLFGDRPEPAAPIGAALYVSSQPAVAMAFGGDAVRVLNGGALRDTIAERLAQIERRGHSLEVDASRGPAHLARIAHEHIQIGLDRLEAAGDAHQPEAARRRLVTGAALAIAAIEALDNQLEQQRDGSFPPTSTPAGGAGAVPPNPAPHPPAGTQASDVDDGDDLIFDEGEPTDEAD